MLVAMIIVIDVHSTELLKKETGAAQRGALGWIGSGNSAELEFHLPAFPFMHSSQCKGPQETFCLKVGRWKHSGSHLLGALRSVSGTRRHCRSHWQDLLALRAGWGCSQAHGASSSCRVLLQLLWSRAMKKDASSSCRTPSW